MNLDTFTFVSHSVVAWQTPDRWPLLAKCHWIASQTIFTLVQSLRWLNHHYVISMFVMSYWAHTDTWLSDRDVRNARDRDDHDDYVGGSSCSDDTFDDYQIENIVSESEGTLLKVINVFVALTKQANHHQQLFTTFSYENGSTHWSFLLLLSSSSFYSEDGDSGVLFFIHTNHSHTDARAPLLLVKFNENWMKTLAATTTHTWRRTNETKVREENMGWMHYANGSTICGSVRRIRCLMPKVDYAA